MPTSRIIKSGNRAVLVLPPEYLRERNLKIGDEVSFEIFKKADLSRLFGVSRHLKVDAQKARNYLRKQWQ